MLLYNFTMGSKMIQESLTFYQSVLLGPGKLFYVPFPAHGLFFCCIFLIIYKFNRPPAPGISGTLPLIMGLHPLVKVVRIAGIQRSVITFYDISIMDHYPMLPLTASCFKYYENVVK